MTRAVAALTALDASHRRGQGERTLDFAEAAATTVELVADGTKRGEASVRRSGLNARTLTPPVDPDEFAPEPNAAGVVEPRLAPAKPFDLTNTYSIDGWYGDAYQDLIPDRTDTTLVVGDAADSLGAAHIAARLGLETTGITLPITKRDEKVKEPGAEPSPILVGRNNALVQQLIKIGKTRLDDLRPGEGEVQIVPRAFGNATATVVAGADPAGTLAASRYLAGRPPYLWDVQRGALTYEDLAGEVTKFLAAKSGAGQASQAAVELKAVLDDLKGKTIESFGARLFIEKGDKALDAHLASLAKTALGESAAVTVTSQGVTDPATVFEDKIEIPWEVDEFRARFKSDVLPKVKAGVSVEHRGAPERAAPGPGLARGRTRGGSQEGRRVRRQGARAVGLQAGLLVADRGGRAGPQGTPRDVGARAGRDLQAGPEEAVQVLLGADPLAARALSRRRDLPARPRHPDPRLPDGARRRREGDLRGRGDRRGRPRRVQRHVQPEVRRTRVPREVPGLVARRSDHRVADGPRGRPGGRGRPHRDRPRAVLGLLPGEGAAADLRQRDEGDRRQADGRQAAVPPRPRHRSVDERARREDRRRRGTGLVARGAARGHLLRHARLLLGDGAHADEEPPERAGQGVSDRAPGPARPARRGPHPLCRERLDEGEAGGHLQGEGRRSPHVGLPRPLADRHHRPPRRPRRRPRGPRQRDRTAGRGQGRQGGDARRGRDRRAWRPPGGGTLQDGPLVRPRGPGGPGRRAQGRAHAARGAEHGSVHAVERAHGAPGRAADARRVGSHHRTRRVRADRGRARGVSGGPQLQGRPVVSRPRHLGDGDHAPGDRASSSRRPSSPPTSRRS